MTRTKVQINDNEDAYVGNGDFIIDVSDLQRELTSLPSMLFKYKVMYADAKVELMAFENEFEIMEAEVDSDIRANPEKYGLIKLTEASVVQAKKKADNLTLMKKKKLELTKTLLILQGVIDCLDAKRASIHTLAKLDMSSMLYTDTTTDSIDNEPDQTRRKNALKLMNRHDINMLSEGKPNKNKKIED